VASGGPAEAGRYDYGLFLCIGQRRRDNVMDHL
jgi:hypothetical protein